MAKPMIEPISFRVFEKFGLALYKRIAINTPNMSSQALDMIK